MNSSAAPTTPAATQALVNSVAAAVVSPSATEAQRAAAMQYLASLVTIGAPHLAGQPSGLPAPSDAPPSFAVATAPGTAPPSFAAATAASDAAVGTTGATAQASAQFPHAVDTQGTVAPFAAGVLFDIVPHLHLHDFTARDNGQPWYAVVRGKKVGITQDHDLAASAVLGVSNNGWKSHKTLAGALANFNHALDLGLVQVRPF
ncbi:hypothetical protein C8F04DRAFT_1253346 [Mycena alexandri]|uniref:Ribonuclease H1 N-terminal domain-containing protein n=1 Tax=Mycena alexandri TaxID=1745969 RepID=A0AAD6TBC8_9AGAR|nr:hypothetical protein C8F04DRAFT_1253346 [Mycena alexandri]